MAPVASLVVLRALEALRAASIVGTDRVLALRKATIALNARQDQRHHRQDRRETYDSIDGLNLARASLPDFDHVNSSPILLDEANTWGNPSLFRLTVLRPFSGCQSVYKHEKTYRSNEDLGGELGLTGPTLALGLILALSLRLGLGLRSNGWLRGTQPGRRAGLPRRTRFGPVEIRPVDFGLAFAVGIVPSLGVVIVSGLRSVGTFEEERFGTGGVENLIERPRRQGH